MSKPLRIDCPSPDEIPSVARIRELATADQHVVLQFPQPLTAAEKCDFIDQLAKRLPDYSVFDSGEVRSTSIVTIKKVITREEVTANADILVEVACEFRRTADRLCRELAMTKGIEPSRLLEHRDRGGTLRDGWKYNFHGLQCRFENTNTKQVVEVEISFGDEFGVLDPYFFGLFIRSTPRLKRLGKLLPDLYHDTRRALSVLEEQGHLSRVGNSSAPSKSGVVAR